MTRTLIHGGTVVDGTGAPPFPADVLIEDDRIARVVRPMQTAVQVDGRIDATGRVVAPGFIDMHSHLDFVLPLADHGELVRPFLEQGVTSVVTGNCGLSAAPVSTSSRARLQHSASIALDAPLDWSWEGVGEYLDHVDRQRPAVNVAQLVGHGAVRYAVSERKRGDMSAAELRRAEEIVARAFGEGACGLSFGLGYDPGMYSSLDELAALSRVAARADRVVTSHLKAYSWLSPCYPLATFGAHNLKAIREMLDVARRTEARLQISHFIFVGRRSWPTAPKALRLVDDARREGLDVAIDAFPFTCGNTTVNVMLPYWFLAMGPSGFNTRWARTRLRSELGVALRLVGFSWDDYQVMEAGVPGWEDLNGLTLPEIGRRWGVRAFDALLRLAETSDGAALVLLHAYSGDREGRGPIDEVLAHEACLFETDAVVRSTGWPNPATVGTFPKILGDQVRRRRRMPLETAVHRMTGASAARFGLKDRGRLARGMAADVVVFDRETISDAPTRPGEPPGRPLGIDHVLVNGLHAVRDGVYDPTVRAGRALRA